MAKTQEEHFRDWEFVLATEGEDGYVGCMSDYCNCVGRAGSNPVRQPVLADEEVGL